MLVRIDGSLMLNPDDISAVQDKGSSGVRILLRNGPTINILGWTSTDVEAKLDESV